MNSVPNPQAASGVVAFPAARRARRGAAAIPAGGAEILLFLGVRYERRDVADGDDLDARGGETDGIAPAPRRRQS